MFTCAFRQFDEDWFREKRFVFNVDAPSSDQMNSIDAAGERPEEQLDDVDQDPNRSIAAVDAEATAGAAVDALESGTGDANPDAVAAAVADANTQVTNLRGATDTALDKVDQNTTEQVEQVSTELDADVDSQLEDNADQAAGGEYEAMRRRNPGMTAEAAGAGELDTPLEWRNDIRTGKDFDKFVRRDFADAHVTNASLTPSYSRRGKTGGKTTYSVNLVFHNRNYQPKTISVEGRAFRDPTKAKSSAIDKAYKEMKKLYRKGQRLDKKQMREDVGGYPKLKQAIKDMPGTHNPEITMENGVVEDSEGIVRNTAEATLTFVFRNYKFTVGPKKSVGKNLREAENDVISKLADKAQRLYKDANDKLPLYDMDADPEHRFGDGNATLAAKLDRSDVEEAPDEPKPAAEEPAEELPGAGAEDAEPAETAATPAEATPENEAGDDVETTTLSPEAEERKEDLDWALRSVDPWNTAPDKTAELRSQITAAQTDEDVQAEETAVRAFAEEMGVTLDENLDVVQPTSNEEADTAETAKTGPELIEARWDKALAEIQNSVAHDIVVAETERSTNRLNPKKIVLTLPNGMKSKIRIDFNKQTDGDERDYNTDVAHFTATSPNGIGTQQRTGEGAHSDMVIPNVTTAADVAVVIAQELRDRSADREKRRAGPSAEEPAGAEEPEEPSPPAQNTLEGVDDTQETVAQKMEAMALSLDGRLLKLGTESLIILEKNDRLQYRVEGDKLVIEITDGNDRTLTLRAKDSDEFRREVKIRFFEYDNNIPDGTLANTLHHGLIRELEKYPDILDLTNGQEFHTEFANYKKVGKHIYYNIPNLLVGGEHLWGRLDESGGEDFYSDRNFVMLDGDPIQVKKKNLSSKDIYISEGEGEARVFDRDGDELEKTRDGWYKLPSPIIDIPFKYVNGDLVEKPQT